MPFSDLELGDIERDLEESGITKKTKKLAKLIEKRKMLLWADISKFFHERKYRSLYKRLFNQKKYD